MFQRGTCWQYLDSGHDFCFVHKEKKRVNLRLSLTLTLTLAPQRGLVCTLFSCSVAGTMNQGTKAEHSQTAWHALTIQSLGKKAWTECPLPPLLLPSLPCYKLLHCLSGAIWRGCYSHSAPPISICLWENKFHFTLLFEITFLNMLNSLNWLPPFAATTERDLGSGQSSVCNCIKEVLASAFTQHTPHRDTHIHIIGSYLSVQQMEVLWTAACTEMWIARLSYHNPADIDVWLQPQATVHRRDRKQNSESCHALAVAHSVAKSCAENAAEVSLRRPELLEGTQRSAGWETDDHLPGNTGPPGD